MEEVDGVDVGLEGEEGLRLNISVIFVVCGPAAAFGGEIGFLRVFRGRRGGFMDVVGAAGDGQ